MADTAVAATTRVNRRAPSGPSHTVEIIVPDEYCAALLLEHAESRFPARIVHENDWVVRLRPALDGADWVVDLFALLERWLALAPLPCVTLRYGGRRYLLRAPSGTAVS